MKPIQLFSIFLKIAKGFLWVFAVIFVAGLLYSLFVPTAYPNLEVIGAFDPGLGVGRYRRCIDCDSSTQLLFSDLLPRMKIWLLIRGLLILFLVLYSVHILQKIVSSIAHKATFYQNNISAFRKLASLGFILSFLACFNFFIREADSELYLNLPLGPLGYSLACLLLAEIFKEGKSLAEENKAII